jgi:hypothetical protein
MVPKENAAIKLQNYAGKLPHTPFPITNKYHNVANNRNVCIFCQILLHSPEIWMILSQRAMYFDGYRCLI